MLHVLYFQNNSKLFTGKMRRLKKKKSVGDEVEKFGIFSIQINSRHHNNKYCKSLLKCHKIWKIISDKNKVEY